MSATPIAKLTEADVIALLHRRYTRVRAGTTADRYVRASHVHNTQSPFGFGWLRRDPDGMPTAHRIADYIAIDKFPSHQAMHGHEVKVSRSDWLSELRQPEKSEDWRRWCNYWWIVTTAGVVKPGEIPAGWGHLEVSKTGTVLRAKVTAERSTAEPMPLDVVAGIAYAAQKHERNTRA